MILLAVLAYAWAVKNSELTAGNGVYGKFLFLFLSKLKKVIYSPSHPSPSSYPTSFASRFSWKHSIKTCDQNVRSKRSINYSGSVTAFARGLSTANTSGCRRDNRCTPAGVPADHSCNQIADSICSSGILVGWNPFRVRK